MQVSRSMQVRLDKTGKKLVLASYTRGPGG